MEVMILGAAGMVGSKLTARLIRDGNIGGKTISKVTLVDVIAPAEPSDAPFAVETLAADLSETGVAASIASAHWPPSN